MKEFALQAIPSPRSIILHAITDAGAMRSGQLPNLARVADYCDYVNKDGATAAVVQGIIDELVRDGMLAIEGEHWRLLRDFP
ncbi:MAG: hypothetical protein JRJ84_23965 [Deltaproteobacteria bacterium]|nr:hypothetical protein [Deltaproteobacteria bacterium]